ncbi:hypothetical protein GLOIN_2v1767945 [Rhizophagus clarus]|uniref:Uncharacterized protein n=1 Tax=Rhizophagus clarus TaxID=94130 RepID=A0A8H3L163_9GLOM|nr:hypothetical protein GLOIN_2v1767945 [Rhizophagus clarus]
MSIRPTILASVAAIKTFVYPFWILDKHRLLLIDILTTHITGPLSDNIPRYVNNSELFKLQQYLETHTDLSPIHPVYLFFHNFVPKELVINLFRVFISSFKLRKSLLLKFLNSLFSDFKCEIWNIHAHNLKSWERSQLNITSRSKKELP